MKPNILLIVSDQHRFDCIGAFGNRDIKTPNLDRLVSEGVGYTNCFCPFPLCTPSRYSMFTGLYVHQHLGWTNHSTIPPELPTFPKILRQAGYRTKAIGKMHLTPTYMDIGFDEMLLAEQHGPGRHDDDYHRYLREKELTDAVDLMDQVNEYREKAPSYYWDTFGAIESNLDEEHHSTTWIADRAMEALESWDGEGNMLMVSFIKPHHPFDPPAPWSAMYDPENLSLLPGWTDECLERDLEKDEGYFFHRDLTEKKMRRILAYYYATISQIDHHVGRMMQYLEQKGLYDNTMIIYTSDHGDYMGFHHMLLKNNYMYDPLMKVPLIIKYPRGMHKKPVSSELVSTLDIGPTILKQAGCKPGAFMKGLDLAENSRGRDVVFAHYFDQKHEKINPGEEIKIHVWAADNPKYEIDYGNFYDEYMVRTKRYKLLYLRDESKCLFFDLEKDPYEMVNLYSDPGYSEQVNEHLKLLYNWMLFEAKPPVYVDENARQIDRPNVPPAGREHRQASIDYFREKTKF